MSIWSGGLRARRTGEFLTFTCDDCKCELTMRDSTGEIDLERSTLGKVTGAWSVTRRKQRCPGCTEKARARGWVK